MISHETEDRLLLGLQVALVIIMFLAICYPVYITWRIEKECLALGYRDAKRPLFTDGYCMIRTDQSDIVVPIAEARKGGRK
jgi:hypothetical protein